MKKAKTITIFGIIFLIWAISTFITVSLTKLEDLGTNLNYLTNSDESLFMIMGIIFALWLFVIGLGILRRDMIIYRLLMIFIWLWNVINFVAIFIVLIMKEHQNLKYIFISLIFSVLTLLFFNRKAVREEFKK